MYGQCGPGYGYGRRHFSLREVAEWLGEYEKELEAELQGVKERRAALTKQE